MKEKSAPHTFIQVKVLGELARTTYCLNNNLLLLQESFHKLSIFVSEDNSCEQFAILQFRNLFSHVVLYYFLKRPEESFMSLKFYVWGFFSQLCKFVQKPQTTLTLIFFFFWWKYLHFSWLYYLHNVLCAEHSSNFFGFFLVWKEQKLFNAVNKKIIYSVMQSRLPVVHSSDANSQISVSI